MNTLTNFLNPFSHSGLDNTQYEVIENELLESSDFKGLSISGSLFSLTTFKNVTFKSCVFFGSRIENCIFVNCNFIDCSFQFTTIEHTEFRCTNFERSIWDVSPVRKSTFISAGLDMKTRYFAIKENNDLQNCFTTDITVVDRKSLESNEDETMTLNIENFKIAA